MLIYPHSKASTRTGKERLEEKEKKKKKEDEDLEINEGGEELREYMWKQRKTNGRKERAPATYHAVEALLPALLMSMHKLNSEVKLAEAWTRS